jgi:hypothetical protein
VKPIPYHKGAFAELETPKLFRNYEADLGEAVRTLTAGMRCARYVAVTRGTFSFSGSNQTFGGIGNLYTGAMPLGTLNLHAVYWIRVYDGETFTLLKKKVASNGEENFFDAIHGPHRKVDESFWPKSPDGAAQDSRMREGIRELVSRSMDATLPELPIAE